MVKPNIERLLTTMRGGITDRAPNCEILLEVSNVKYLLVTEIAIKEGIFRPYFLPMTFHRKTAVPCWTLVWNLVFTDELY